MNDTNRYAEARRVTLVGVVLNVALSAIKVVFGIVGSSQALVVDGIHSVSDLASDGLVLLAAKHGAREADAEHPYGHARIETAVTVALGVLLLGVAGGIILDASRRLFAPETLLIPGMLALFGAVVSILSKEFLYHYTMAVAKRLRSNLLRANAWHHRSDSISSIVVLVGIGGTMAGLPYLDAIATVGVALMIVHIAWQLSWHSVKELIDTGLETERVEAIRQAITSIDGVKAHHMLRTRKMGADALVDVHILVPPKISVSEAHHISERVRSNLIKQIDEVADVTVHIDPEDDENLQLSQHLPLRGVLIQRLHEQWRELEAANHIDDITLHYLNSKVHVEVLLPLASIDKLKNASSLAARFAEAAEAIDEVADVELRFH